MELKEGERCCIIGTLFKKMDLRPTILKEISALVRPDAQPHSQSSYVTGNESNKACLPLSTTLCPSHHELNMWGGMMSCF